MVSQVDALLTHLGTGRWTLLYFFIGGYGSFLLAPHALGGAFLAPRLDYSCHVPNTSTSAANTSLSMFLLQANSSSTLDTQAKCEYTIDTPDGERIEKCKEFDFDNSTFSSTFTSEYNLACDRAYLQTSFQSLYMFGVFVGAPVNGYLADKYGRKNTVITGLILYLAVAVGSAWLPFLSTIIVARFLLGYLHAICCFTSYILMVEMIGPKTRTIAGFTVYNLWAAGMLVYGLVGYLIRDWRILQTVVTLPGLLILPFLWLIEESPRWLIVNGRPEEALQVLGKVARWHRVDLPHETEMKKMVEEQVPKVQGEGEPFSVRGLLKAILGEAVMLFRTPRLRTITLCICIDYLVAGMVYFGLSLSGASISDDPYLFMVLSGLMEVPAYTLTVPIVQRFGRKRTLSVFFTISGVVLFSLAVTPAGYSKTLVALAMIGKLAITGGFQTVIFYSSELFPTEVRSRGIGISYMMSRIGSMVSPFITDLVGTVYPWAPFVVFGTGAVLAGAGTLLLPETRGQILPDTVAQLEAAATEETKKRIKLPRILTRQTD